MSSLPVLEQILGPFEITREKKERVSDYQYQYIELESKKSNTRSQLETSLLVGETTGGGFETLGGDKTHCFISRTKAYN